jgi:hypothetical protein
MKKHQRTTGKNDTWLTPPEIFNALGEFDVDPCAAQLPEGAKLPWPMAGVNVGLPHDGLHDDWWRKLFGRKPRMWCNPPFNRYQRPKWMRKMAEHGNGILLIPAATETEAFFKYVWAKADAVCFVKGRPHFHYIDGTRAKANCGCSIALVAYGADNVAALEAADLGKTIRLNHATP